MRLFATLCLIFSAAALTACSTQSDAPEANGEPIVSPILTSDDAKDPYSYAQPEIARVTHVALDLALDFENRNVGGTATLDIMAADGADTVILDTMALEISSVTDDAGNALPFELGAAKDGMGAPLAITMGDKRQVVITYTSGPDAKALQWLVPAQTAGGEHPYLLSQGQPTLNRTWIPTQDSPGIRQTWEAKITAPDPLTVVMSGLSGGDPVDTGEGRRTFSFAMDKPVAPYLIAIAAGDIVFQELGPRSGVWTEPVMLDRAAAELADTEKMIDAAEELYGEYRWGRYDMIVLPPSFPYGGMENPVMTFLTPTFIAGDRSLTGLIAHELAHSWSGNLVTNANWADSWLNEGTTSYFENRIIEKLYGEKRASQERALNFAAMEDTIAEEGAANAITALHLTGENAAPEGGTSGVIYDKGATFLHTVESIVGREKFDVWLESWFDRHAFEPATSAMFLADMRDNLVKGDEGLEARLMLDEWVYKPGLPSNALRPDPAAFAEVDKAAEAYASSRTLDEAVWGKWTSAERLRLLSKLPRDLSDEELAKLDNDLGLSASGNNEILFAWLELALQNRYEPAVPLAEKFLGTVGRRKFVSPLFEALMEQGTWGQPIARRIYAKTRSGYHAVTTGTVDEVLSGGG
ncbi:M1 family metallopeptidase [Sphingorhabdus sp. Alg239-R122]|uniref:M1 family metallopeptidase n=1 Tax=Sphingorhabdus sp. Alg239-R122 TaxID=2305989 RepID=UPI0013DBFFB2|nr:M1 family metallopeptidase [Sphingorhabdus sp. Alg239-R122]